MKIVFFMEKLRNKNKTKKEQLNSTIIILLKKVAFTMPQDASINATFNFIFWSKSPSLEVRRIELRSKRHTHRFLPL